VPKESAAPAPTEAQEQEALFRWAAFARGKHPELALLYHIPNGGSRHKLEAANMKRQGVRAGVPDLCLPVPRGGYGALYIELKRTRGGRLNSEQENWLEMLRTAGNAAVVCYGWEDAKAQIEAYLVEKKTNRKGEKE
jgi:hypothetical protein